MKIRYVSDLHLEHRAELGEVGRLSLLSYKLIPPMPDDANTILVLAGDIHPSLDDLMTFIEKLIPRFLRVIHVPGNHELYGNEFNSYADAYLDASMRSPLFMNFWPGCIDGIAVYTLDDTVFLCGTMWGTGDDGHVLMNQLNDFKYIEYENRTWTVEDMILMNQKSKRELLGHLDFWTSNHTVNNIVVITHHAPVKKVLKRPGVVDGGYWSGCEQFMSTPKLKAWIYGHTHHAQFVNDYGWGDCVVMSNPLGYPGEKTKFNSRALFEF